MKSTEPLEAIEPQTKDENSDPGAINSQNPKVMT
jgi:hypothetical protein